MPRPYPLRPGLFFDRKVYHGDTGSRKGAKEERKERKENKLNRKGRKGDAKTARSTRTSLRPLRLLFAPLRETGVKPA